VELTAIQALMCSVSSIEERSSFLVNALNLQRIYINRKENALKKLTRNILRFQRIYQKVFGLILLIALKSANLNSLSFLQRKLNFWQEGIFLKFLKELTQTDYLKSFGRLDEKKYT